MTDNRDAHTEQIAETLCRGMGSDVCFNYDPAVEGGCSRCRQDAEALLPVVARIKADAAAETVAAVEAECDRLAQAADDYEPGQWEYAGGLREAQHHVRAALSAGRTALDTRLAQAWDEGYRAVDDANPYEASGEGQ